jgi:hypothetical protein
MLIASCRRSWNRCFDSPALFTSRFHAIFAVFFVIGRMRSDTRFVAIAAPQSGTARAQPFSVIGMRNVRVSNETSDAFKILP